MSNSSAFYERAAFFVKKSVLHYFSVPTVFVCIFCQREIGKKVLVNVGEIDNRFPSLFRYIGSKTIAGKNEIVRFSFYQCAQMWEGWGEVSAFNSFLLLLKLSRISHFWVVVAAVDFDFRRWRCCCCLEGDRSKNKASWKSSQLRLLSWTCNTELSVWMERDNSYSDRSNKVFYICNIFRVCEEIWLNLCKSSKQIIFGHFWPLLKGAAFF